MSLKDRFSKILKDGEPVDKGIVKFTQKEIENEKKSPVAGQISIPTDVDIDNCWITKDGQAIKIEDLEDFHLKNIIKYFTRYPNMVDFKRDIYRKILLEYNKRNLGRAFGGKRDIW